MSLAGAIAKFVARCPPSRVREIVAKLRVATPIDGIVETQVEPGAHLTLSSSSDSRSSANDGFGEHFFVVADAWRFVPTVDRDGLALAIESALEARLATYRPLELVWTGAPSDGARTRNTTATLFEIVHHARVRLLLMSFSAYPISGFVDALLAAATRGVAIRFVLESSAESGGTLRVDASHPFARLRGVAAFYVWPHALRPPHASMHAKAAVADGTRALVTSANLTESGIDANIELGTYFEDRFIASQIEASIDGLIASRTLVRVP